MTGANRPALATWRLLLGGITGRVAGVLAGTYGMIVGASVLAEIPPGPRAVVAGGALGAGPGAPWGRGAVLGGAIAVGVGFVALLSLPAGARPFYLLRQLPDLLGLALVSLLAGGVAFIGTLALAWGRTANLAEAAFAVAAAVCLTISTAMLAAPAGIDWGFLVLGPPTLVALVLARRIARP